MSRPPAPGCYPPLRGGVATLARVGQWIDGCSTGFNAVGRSDWNALKTRAWKLHPLMVVVSAVFGWYFWKGLLP